MNNRWGEPPHPEQISTSQGTIPAGAVTALKAAPEPLKPSRFILPATQTVKPLARLNGRKNHTLHKDSQFIVKSGEWHHVISENYSYKSDSYYTILTMETEEKRTKPSTSSVIDAFVVPICLERAKLAGIPVCEWEISQAYVPLPAIIYGLNYFATTSEFFAVYNNEKAKEVIKHITNKGKYPFCYQKFGEGAEISQCTAIFGKTISQNDAVSHIAEKVYELFSIPLVTMVLVRNGENYALSSLSQVRYSHLSDRERSLLEAHISHQEFL